MRYGMDARAEALRYFEMGLADKLVGRLLGIPHETVRKWLYAYRALGKEALFVTRRKAYPHGLKVGAARAVVGEGKARPEVMGPSAPSRRPSWTPGAGSTAREASCGKKGATSALPLHRHHRWPGGNHNRSCRCSRR